MTANKRMQAYVQRTVYLREYAKDMRTSNIFAVMVRRMEAATKANVRILRDYGVRLFLYSVVSSLLIVGAGSSRESRTGSEQGSLGAESLDDGSIHTSVELHAKDAVHAVHISTHLLVISRNTGVGGDVDIFVGQQGEC